MTNVITLKINNMDITVPEGTLIIEAAKSVGIQIPHFCYHPKLSLMGGCRMCLVEVEKSAKLVTACTTPVSQNMKVSTESDKVKEAQKGMLAFLLINHPLDCPVCDKGGECPLQDNTYKYGPAKGEFIDEKWHFDKPVNLSPLIVLDRERCILCTRCVRFQEEIAFQPELFVANRGRGSYIETLKDKGFKSNYSGNTIELCPVGALTSRPYRFKARPWDTNRIASICPHCGCGCNVYLDVRENKVVRMLSRGNPSVDDGWLCDRGRFGYLFVNDPERLKTPMIKIEGKLIPCSYDEAVSTITDGIRKIAEKHGREYIAGLVSPQLTNEELYVFRKFMTEVIMTDNIAYSVDRPAGEESIGLFGFGGLKRFSFRDIDEADLIFIVEGDPGKDLPILDLRIKKAIKRGVKLFITGPEEIELSQYASGHLKSVPGSPEFINAVSSEIKDSVKCVALISPKINPEKFESVISLLKEFNSKLKNRGWISAGILWSDANMRGAQDMGIMPAGRRNLSDRQKCLIAARTEIPDINSLTIRPEFLIVYDFFLTETARAADVVMPAAAFSELNGTYTNAEGRVQRLFKAVKPAQDAKLLWKLMMSIANGMGAEWNYSSSEDVMKEIAEKVPTYKSISYKRIGMEGCYAD